MVAIVEPVIERATELHRDDLARLVLGLLSHGRDKATMELRATEANANTLVDLVLMPAAAEGYPILLAYFNDQLAGGLWWHPPSPLLEYKRKIVSGSTYVLPEFRSRGISRRLRTLGMDILKRIGVEEIRGVVDHRNTESIQALKQMRPIELGRYLTCVL